LAEHVAVTHEELEEWSSDPEGFIRCGQPEKVIPHPDLPQLESGPDADKPVGVGLLLCAHISWSIYI
jgi:hypothetical protein